MKLMMNTRNRNFNVAGYLPCIFLLLIVTPSNYLGRCASARNAFVFASPTETTATKDLTGKVNTTITLATPLEDSTQPWITKPIMIYLFLATTISVVLYGFILSYFNSQSLVNQCLSFYLYKDIIRSGMATTCVTFFGLGINYASDNEHDINKSLAKVICLTMYGVLLLTLVLFNMAATFRLYTLMKMIVDPPMPWGDDELSGIRIIRVVTGSLVLIFIMSMYALGIYPPFYYIYIGNYEQLTALPKGTVIFPILFIILMITLSITSIGATYYQVKNQNNIDTGIFIFMPFDQIMYVVILALVFVAYTELFEVFLPVKRHNLILIYIPIVNIIAPLFTILKTEQMKAYLARTFLDTLHDMLYLNIKFVLMCFCIYVFIALSVNY